MGRRILLMPRAVRDLREIYQYAAGENPEAARRLRLGLVHELKLVSTFERAGRMVPEFGNPAIRELIRSPYRIIYRLKDQTQTVEILRFWHASRGKPFI
jgi:toxin ParE1/3/4